MSHFSQQQLHTLLRGNPSAQESEVMLAHIAQCDACAGALALCAARLPCAAPPPGMIAETLAKTRQKNRAESLRSYSLRVFAAMAAALILLFSGTFRFLARLPEELPKAQEKLQASFTEIFDFKKEGDPFASQPK